MCRCGNDDAGRGAFYAYPKERKEPLRIRAFYVCLTAAGGQKLQTAPESLMLVYLPRINGGALEVNGSRVRPDAPAFVALHRVRSAETSGDLVYGSTDRVRAGEGVRFEAYVGEERAVKGGFRRREGGGWRMECGCAAEGGAAWVSEAELCVAGEGKVLMRERVEMAPRRRHGRFCSRLEEIPEELGEGEANCDGRGEEDDEWELLESAEGPDSEEEEEEEEEYGGQSWKNRGEEEAEEVAMEGMKWAVDLGIWAVCLGVGFLVSKASYKRRRSILSF
ncbi:hypothetical protein Taro_025239 [Colocasia esculenta]|uniref:Uncharacterized protein n=1 Tax=Colocasia esculenta TaxID=4460 RepID=A0A843V2S0_COLES|nr:hypothetical protein [Colocasia esculenta]